MIWPNYWGWLGASDQTLTPIPPDVVSKVAGNTLPKVKDVFERDEKGPKASQPLSDDVIVEVLTKLSAGGFTLQRPRQAPGHAADHSANHPQNPASPFTSPAAASSRSRAGKLSVSGDDDAVANKYAQAYAWPLAHDVRPAAQSLGVPQCAGLSLDEGTIYFANVAAIGPINPHARSRRPTSTPRRFPFMQHAWALGFRNLHEGHHLPLRGVLAAVLLTYGNAVLAGLGTSASHVSPSALRITHYESLTMPAFQIIGIIAFLLAAALVPLQLRARRRAFAGISGHAPPARPPRAQSPTSPPFSASSSSP